jgi:antitoxin component of MazEF toxin-antitoxin module
MSVTFIRKIRQSGKSSPEITIPKPILDAANLSIGQRAAISVKDNVILIRKLKETKKGAMSSE